MARLCTISTFSSVVDSLGRLFEAPRQFIIFGALPPPPKFSSPFLHCAIRRRLLPKGFHEVFMNFLGRHSFFTEVLFWLLWLQLSPFCQFDISVSSLQQLPSVIKSFEIPFSLPKTFNKIKLSTDWDFESILLNLSILGRELFDHTSYYNGSISML